ncbi:hypothetical protein [Cryptosporangium phraense]|uniref:Uncharacterized protein n=1 Tax=Cryptosporangium phraense TaxID=2593070 RepID=A0A545AKV1_9ACTN|nr:hypothetical protein [Cryptosporangium phraense]TQS41890.1 hypothetical protein FL583_26775 [Cryptosporangium phraense]
MADDTTHARSAVTGEFVTDDTAAKHPDTTVVEGSSQDGDSKRNRSAVTGEFVSDDTVDKHPDTTVVEKG